MEYGFVALLCFVGTLRAVVSAMDERKANRLYYVQPVSAAPVDTEPR